jgi:hypothetical protein
VPEIHPDLTALAPLLGVWRGRGHGEYPTIASFDYLEEVSFGHVGKPFLSYSQRTRAVDDDRKLHAETGYLRLPRAGHAELVLAHPTGVTEICEGECAESMYGLTLELRSTRIGLTSTAKEVSAVERSIHVRGDTLEYSLRLGAVGQPLQPHLVAILKRQ